VDIYSKHKAKNLSSKEEKRPVMIHVITCYIITCWRACGDAYVVTSISFSLLLH